MKGLLVDIVRPSTDCTNDGLTSKAGRLSALIAFGFGPSAAIFKPDMRTPAVVVENYYGRLRAVPCDNDGNRLPGPFMFGGNFIYSSDTRFHNVCDYPIPVHDRKE